MVESQQQFILNSLLPAESAVLVGNGQKVTENRSKWTEKNFEMDEMDRN